MQVCVATGGSGVDEHLDRFASGIDGSELQAAALCLVAAAPACAAAWDAAFLGAALWRGGAAAAGRRAALDNLAYYAALLRDGAADGGDDGAAGDDAAPARSLYDRWCGADVSADEAGPFFSTMVCCLVLVPFGVLGPLFFLAKADRVPLVSKSQLMGALVAAVFALVLILTTAANASMDRLKNEARAKVAAYDLRLALRAERVVANPAVARLLVEARDHHAAGAEAAFRRDRPARRRATLGDHAARRVADAADAALRDRGQPSESISAK